MAQNNKKISATFVDFYYKSLSQAPQKIADSYAPDARIAFSLAGKSFPPLTKANVAAVLAEKLSNLSYVAIDMITETLVSSGAFEIKVTGSFSFHDETPKCHFQQNFTLTQLKEGFFAVKKDELIPGRETMNWADDSPPMFATNADVSALPHLGMPSSKAAEEAERQAKAEAEKKAKAEEAKKAAAAAAKKVMEAAEQLAKATEAAALIEVQKAATASAEAEAAAEAAAEAKAEEERKAEIAAKKQAEADAQAKADEERRVREEEAKNIDLSKLSAADRLRVKQGLSLSAPKALVTPAKETAAAPVVAAVAVETESKKTTTATTKTPIPAGNDPGTAIHYDIFIKGLPLNLTQEEVAETIHMDYALVERMKTATKTDKGGVDRVFVFVRVNREVIAERGLDVSGVVADVRKKSEKSEGPRRKIVVEEVKDKEVFTKPTNARPQREARRDDKKAPATTTDAPKKTAAAAAPAPVVASGTSIKIKPASNPWGKIATAAPTPQ